MTAAYRMYLVGHGHRASPEVGDTALTPALRKVVRRLDPGRRAMLLAALDAGAAWLAPDATLIVVAPDTTPSLEMITSARAPAAAAGAGSAASFRGDPTLILEVMDNLSLAALNIGLGFTGDGLGFGAGDGQAIEALLTVAERLEDGASEVLLVAGSSAPARGVASRWSREPAVGARCRITHLERIVAPDATPVQAWLATIPEMAHGTHRLIVGDGAVAAQLVIEVR